MQVEFSNGRWIEKPDKVERDVIRHVGEYWYLDFTERTVRLTEEEFDQLRRAL